MAAEGPLELESFQLADTKKAKVSHSYDAIVDFIAGSLGGTAGVLVGQPLDTVKVKMQTFPGTHRNMIKCFVSTWKTEGFRRGLYAGTVPAIAANVSENSILFCGYGMCQKVVQHARMKKSVHDLNIIENAGAGFIAAFFSSFSLCPTEIVKCRLQAMKEMDKLKGVESSSMKIGPWGLCREILRTDGVRGFFCGLTSTIAREMPGYACFFGGYEGARSFLTPHGSSKDDIGVLKTIFCGGFGGICFWMSIFPADVVKSRIQVENITDGFLTVLMRIAKSEGILALYNGLGPTLVRTFPATGALFLTYEYTKKVFGLAFNSQDID
ncbi:Mitochondrial ornithine transporter 1 [Nymphon striatum]|nr:Mitochondrial ornithine transporter 1 [Nymphon striatum]KAG1710490.1 Mitochondrial ornithine transporter 1 [Nymphon striatum]